MKRALVILGLLTTPVASADDVTPTDNDILAAANALGDCAGLLEYISDEMKLIDKPALSQSMHEAANRALIASAYLLYLRGNKQKPLKDLVPYSKGRAEVMMTRLKAAEETADTTVMLRQQKICDAVKGLQESVVQEVRNETYLQ